MPAGCDFICKNKECKHFDSGFAFLAPWPLGKIELVITSSSVSKNAELKSYLIAQKNEGRKFACIQFPNYDMIPIEAYRISLWSKDAKCIWQYDEELTDKSLEETIKECSQKKCEKTGCNLSDFNEVLKSGIDCPHCGTLMKQNRWYANEQ